MSETKFTKGPWECESTRDRKRICIGVGMFEVNGIYIAEVDTDDITESERDTAKANAHLIAAAPELYEALEKAIISMKEDAVRIHCNDYGENISYEELKARNWHPDDIDAAETALAKARGETT